MMGRGADGGCGTEERLFRPAVPKIPAKISETRNDTVTIDVFSQARKVLSERSPFDVGEDGVLSETNLPSGLAGLLKQNDSRKRHKKSHSGADKKSSSKSERSKGTGIWVETEEYFRDLALPDIDALSEVASVSSLDCKKCFLIPLCGNDNGDNVNVDMNTNVSGRECVRCANGDGDVDAALPEEKVKDQEKKEDDTKEDEKQFMEIDSLADDSLIKEEKNCISDSYVGLEWLLGCRTRALLTSERPSKKRKLLGGDAGLEKILVGCPCEGSSALCDFCCAGDIGIAFNKLIVCSTCKVSVHQKCYGVHEDVEGSWLCSWCKEKKNDTGDSVKQQCVLCPKQGGALKPVHGGSAEFVHLFCSLLMPEVYIQDIMKMEPIMNLGGIKETRKKLVCNVCKVKCGACVRCSHGTCRTSFHPICAREARHRLEVWGKHGCDNVELRAFCSKHSDIHDNSTPRTGDPCLAIGNDPPVSSNAQGTLSMNKLHKLKISHKNGEKIAVHMESSCADSDRSCDSEETVLSDSRSNGVAVRMPECGKAQQFTNIGMLDKSENEDVNPCDSINFILILKKLIDRGKVNVKEIASDIGISPDLLNTTLAQDGSLAPDLRCKIVKWLSNHAYLGGLLKNFKLKIKSSISSKANTGNADSDGLMVSESEIADPVAVKSVPPRRRTKSSIRMLRDNKMACTSEDICNENGITMDHVKIDQLDGEEAAISSRVSISDTTEKNPADSDGFEDSLLRCPLKSEGYTAKPSDCGCQSGEASITRQNNNNMLKADQENPICSTHSLFVPDLIKAAPCSGFYLHPYTHKAMQGGVLSGNDAHDFGGRGDGEISRLEASSTASVCCNHQDRHSKCDDMICDSDGVKLEQLVKARTWGILELSPMDEVEGEIIYFQHRLLGNAAARKRFADNLVCKVAKSLPQEIDAARMRRWDAVLVNQYLCELREAKKQGRKEKRHKEAQAVLAAATAAAAASSRISSFRKDSLEESASQEDFLRSNSHNGRAAISSQVMSRAKETLSRVAGPRVSSEKYSDFLQSVSDFSKEHPRSCDICRRSETILNPILVCSSCKVAVHLDCYRSVKESTGPWYCELCEELLSSRSSGAPSVNFWEKPYFVAECCLCGGTTGAFRKSADGQWVHAFCAEWVFESTFRRGQVNPVAGMLMEVQETVSKGIDVCCICRRKQGICIKCNYGHCQTTFHPTCARSAGFYMNVKSAGGNFQHKAYCEKHSLEQRMKAETQKHGIEELKSIKQIRVELERLRLLCERIIKREKLKRELILCSHEILAFKRDHAARFAHGRIPVFAPDVSSESATTSLKGHTDSFKSCSEAFQRSDDVTVDSISSVKNRVKVPVPMDADQRTDDSSMSQNLFTRKPLERAQFSGKQIPHRAHLSRSLSNEEEWSSKARKPCGTLEKEIVMTSDEASMKNRKLPKGFIFVPVDCLPKEKQINQDVCSAEPVEPDG
ncbi:putative Phd finger protein [Melia azedarach]|uniref:Phd finger protein n=1 Tax=Melia azedarach TaxID=155640 RepID=A0ACC1WPY9_MELAZ|nr:putative Phd finger protein [Melia azedarach]